jgi:hypothetical protein
MDGEPPQEKRAPGSPFVGVEREDAVQVRSASLGSAPCGCVRLFDYLVFR